MVQSMTGFASKVFLFELDSETRVNVSVSIKALNSRFFEASCKLPYIINNLEHKFIKILKKRLTRGHIYLTIHMGAQNALKGGVEPVMNTVKSYVDAARKIKDTLKIEGELTIDSLLQLPGIFSLEERAIDEQSIKKMFEVVESLIDEVIEARKKEGVALLCDLEQRVQVMQKEINAIDIAAERFMEERKAQISQEILDAEQSDQDPIDIRRQSLFSQLDKIDIHEEIVRFKSHVTNFLALLSAPGLEKGKRIDFTLQELAREINTIAAKCSDVGISAMAINIKVEVEKAREQTQNIV